MKPIARILLSALFLAPLLGCQDDPGENKTVFQVDPSSPGSRFGYPGDRPRNAPREERRNETTNPAQDPAGEVPVDPVAENVGPNPETTGPEMGPQPQPDPGPGSGAAATPAPGSPPFAKQVPGMSGYVFSPFSPGKKIEVIGYPPGTVVKCPYTQKEFKVP